MQAQARSLNLSNAVAVVVYEAWRQLGWSSTRLAPKPGPPPLDSD
jgi:tRNA (cytidine/uridine-2'-O-)-methyltransferase